MTSKFSSKHFQKIVFLFFLGIFSALNLPKASASITVDGKLADWGVTPGTFGHSDWVPNAGVYFDEEDTSADEDFVDPGWGGQIYDAEALYTKREGNTLFLSLVTGFPFKGVEHVEFGDFAFDFGSDGTYEFGLETRGNDGFKKGSLYGNAEWLDPAILGATPFDLKEGDLLGSVSYKQGKITLSKDTHYIVEAGIPLSLFGGIFDEGNPGFTLHWTMGCGNDVLEVEVPSDETRPAVPEPSSFVMLVMGFGFLSLLAKHRGLLPVKE